MCEKEHDALGSSPCVCSMEACRRITAVELRTEAGRAALVGRGFRIMLRLLHMLRSERK